MHYNLSKFLKEHKIKIEDCQFIPNPSRGNGLMMICPDGTIRDCEACCEKETDDHSKQVTHSG